MAYESHYWRQILKRDLTYLNKKITLTHKEVGDRIDEHFSYVEIKLMTTAYVIRKLADSGKLPDNTLNKAVSVICYNRNKSEPSRPFIDIEREYNFNSKSVTALPLRDICNQIIHSYILQVVGNNKRAFSEFWVTSDFNKEYYLYEISLKQYIKTLRQVANIQVTKLTTSFDEKKGKWIYRRS